MTNIFCWSVFRCCGSGKLREKAFFLIERKYFAKVLRHSLEVLGLQLGSSLLIDDIAIEKKLACWEFRKLLNN